MLWEGDVYARCLVWRSHCAGVPFLPSSQHGSPPQHEVNTVLEEMAYSLPGKSPVGSTARNLLGGDPGVQPYEQADAQGEGMPRGVG